LEFIAARVGVVGVCGFAALLVYGAPAGAQISERERLNADCIDRANAPGGRTVGGAFLLRPSFGGAITSHFNDPKLLPADGFHPLLEGEALFLGGASGDALLVGVEGGGVFGPADRAYEAMLGLGFNRRRYGASSIDRAPGHCRQEQHDWRIGLAAHGTSSDVGNSALRTRLGGVARLGYRYRAEKWGWEWMFTAGYTWNLEEVAACTGVCRIETLSLRAGIFAKPLFGSAETRLAMRPILSWGPPELTFYELTMLVTFGVETHF
jgi:hypothetical protein